MAAEPDLTELETKSQAFDFLLTMDETRDTAERALDLAMHMQVHRIAV